MVDWLMERIVHGEFRPGRWVSENELAAAAGVSRAPVREALRILASEGLVEIHPRRGTVIADLNARDASDIYGARMLIEAEAIRQAGREMTDADYELLEGILDRMRATVADPRSYLDEHRAFHETILEKCPNRVLVEFVGTLRRRALRFRSILLRLPGQIEQSVATHQRIVAALRDGNPDGAAEIMRQLIDAGRTTLLRELFINIGEGAPLPRGTDSRFSELVPAPIVDQGDQS